MPHFRDSAVAKIIDFTEEARDDYDQSFDWYAGRSAKAAVRFATVIEAAFDAIVAKPDEFPRTGRGCQYCSLKRFPFRIVFYQDLNRIVIVAIAHAKRRPGYWFRRLP
jgi:plasmid stabilization system protein ParE